MLERVLYHDHCFDGAASAAFFSRFIAGAIHPDAEFRYTGMAHKASQTVRSRRCSMATKTPSSISNTRSDPRLTWWFDHHQSAFLNAEDAEHFRRDTSGRKLYDPSYKSCTVVHLPTVACDRFGFHAPDLDDLVHWSLIIDGAQYPDARTAVELGAPAMKLTLVIEAAKGSRHRAEDHRLDAAPAAGGDHRGAGDPGAVRAAVPAAPGIDRSDPASARGRTTAWCSSTWRATTSRATTSSFRTTCFPTSTYTVSVSPSSFRTKISVGSNPWTPVEPKHNLATICERYGGGGHARVGAISLSPGELEQAREIAAEIVAELKT